MLNTRSSELEPSMVFPSGGRTPAMQVIDVRAPVEVARCAIPGAMALPILSDAERHMVGTCYREHGSEAAMALGLQLTKSHRDDRVAAWRRTVVEADRPSVFMCWRGGDRSRTAQAWLGDDDVLRVRGGSKALRRFLMQQLPVQMAATRPVVVAGLTGSGKTEFLHAVAAAGLDSVHSLDLEGLAHHRGSAFGGFADAQPSQQSFENSLAASMQLASARMTLLEDEARHVGRLQLPLCVWQALLQSPVILLEAPDDERVARIAREYVFAPTGDSSQATVMARLQGDLRKLHKRLGEVRLRECLGALSRADREGQWLSVAAHAPWIQALLAYYYDPLYERSLKQLQRPVLVRGTAAEVLPWLARQVN